MLAGQIQLPLPSPPAPAPAPAPLATPLRSPCSVVGKEAPLQIQMGTWRAQRQPPILLRVAEQVSPGINTEEPGDPPGRPLFGARRTYSRSHSPTGAPAIPSTAADSMRPQTQTGEIPATQRARAWEGGATAEPAPCGALARPQRERLALASSRESLPAKHSSLLSAFNFSPAPPVPHFRFNWRVGPEGGASQGNKRDPASRN